LSELILVNPSKVLEEKIIEYRQEYLDFEETNIDGSCGLARGGKYEVYIEKGYKLWHYLSCVI